MVYSLWCLIRSVQYVAYIKLTITNHPQLHNNAILNQSFPYTIKARIVVYNGVLAWDNHHIQYLYRQLQMFIKLQINIINNKKTSHNVDLLLALVDLSVRFWDVFYHMYIGYYIRVIFIIIKREIVLRLVANMIRTVKPHLQQSLFILTLI